MKLSEISQKDIINDDDGAKLGKIVDLDIDVATGKIINVNIASGFRLANMFSKDSLSIPWNKIIKIGNDVVIVEKDLTKIKEKKE